MIEQEIIKQIGKWQVIYYIYILLAKFSLDTSLPYKIYFV